MNNTATTQPSSQTQRNIEALALDFLTDTGQLEYTPKLVQLLTQVFNLGRQSVLDHIDHVIDSVQNELDNDPDDN